MVTLNDLLTVDRSWMAQANCASEDGKYVEVLFPRGQIGRKPHNYDRDRLQRQIAADVCFGGSGQFATVCVVREKCLAAGYYETEGIWGGRTEEERRHLRRHKKITPCYVVNDDISNMRYIGDSS